MEVTGKDILNLACAVKIVKTTKRAGHDAFDIHLQKTMHFALQEAIDKYREQLKGS